MIVFDTIIENLPNKFYRNRPWSKGNNPKTAVVKYLKEIKNKNYFDQRGRKLKFIKDDMIENKILLTTSPGGFLKRVQ